MRESIIQKVVSVSKEENPKKNIITTEYYGENTFSFSVMKKKLSKSMYQKIKKCIQGQSRLTLDIANEVAHAMKEWALEQGATHYAHWFQPLTGSTAEKHDSFISYDDSGNVIERFSGKELFKQEPDASSFPSGGLRATFEARGYTAWDPTSPAFIIEDASGKTLCIPSVFVTYNGYALDQKSPLLRSMDLLEEKSKELLAKFGVNANKVFSDAGPEQEYFLVDKKLAYLRPDIILTGRTLFGATPPKGQQLDDQYFGSIKSRMLAFMREVEKELYKLGIPVKTRHNEVAPHQYEFAPIYEDANLASDHNQLMMEILKKVGSKHDFYVLLHEKPFARINGSGKHVNWSISADNIQLMNPGEDPEHNLLFLTFFLASIRGVYKYSSLLRASVASASNDHRLGGNEAPPAIISVFLGKELSNVLNKIDKQSIDINTFEKAIDLGISKLPEINRDNTDRNRTSPFAFTGNKFEFRAVGSNQSISIPVTFLNTITAESIEYISKKLKNIKNRDMLVKQLIPVLREIISEVRPILFEGDNYTTEWQKEAKKRGLPNLVNTPEAVNSMLDKENVKLLSDYGIFSKDELHARHEIELEKYCNLINIEAKTAIEIVRTKILPACLEYQAICLGNLKSMMDVLGDKKIYSNISELAESLTVKINSLIDNVDKFDQLVNKAESEKDIKKCSKFYAEKVVKEMEILRENVDSLELIVDDKMWPLPKYYELLFID